MYRHAILRESFYAKNQPIVKRAAHSNSLSVLRGRNLDISHDNRVRGTRDSTLNLAERIISEEKQFLSDQKD